MLPASITCITTNIYENGRKYKKIITLSYTRECYLDRIVANWPRTFEDYATPEKNIFVLAKSHQFSIERE